ncbi:MAG: EamA family transporter [Candidatus Acidiferrales bacterium]
MKSAAGLRLKTFFLLLVMILFGPLGDVLLSKGMKDLGKIPGWSPTELAHVFLAVFSSGTIWLGIGSLLGFFIAYTLVLSWADYSYVQPASSLAYGIVALLGHFLLGEKVSPLRWAGILVICCGVLIVGHTPPRTTEQG